MEVGDSARGGTTNAGFERKASIKLLNKNSSANLPKVVPAENDDTKRNEKYSSMIKELE